MAATLTSALCAAPRAPPPPRVLRRARAVAQARLPFDPFGGRHTAASVSCARAPSERRARVAARASTGSGSGGAAPPPSGGGGGGGGGDSGDGEQRPVILDLTVLIALMFGMYYAFKSFVTEPMRIKEEEAKAKAKAEAKVKAEAEAKARAAAEAARRAAAVAAAAAAPAASKPKAAVPAAPKPAFKPKAAPVKTTSIDESFLTLKSVKETYDAVKGKFKAIAKMALRGGHALTVTMPADVFSIQSGSQASGVGAPSFSLKESSTGAEAAFDTSNNKLSLKASVFEAEDIDVTAKCAIHGGKVMPTLEAKYSAPAVLDGATLNAAVDFSAKKASLKAKATQKDVELLDGDGTLTYKLETGVKGGEAQGGAAVIASLPEDSLHSLKLCASVGNVGGDEEKCDGGMRLAASVLPYDPLNLKVTAAINKASAVSATVDLESSHTVLEDIAGGFKVALGVRAVPAVELKKLSLEKTWTF